MAKWYETAAALAFPLTAPSAIAGLAAGKKVVKKVSGDDGVMVEDPNSTAVGARNANLTFTGNDLSSTKTKYEDTGADPRIDAQLEFLASYGQPTRHVGGLDSGAFKSQGLASLNRGDYAAPQTNQAMINSSNAGFRQGMSGANQLATLGQQARGNQLSALAIQRQAAEGNAPSAALAQQAAGLNQLQRNNLASAASARGGVGARMLAQKAATEQNTIAGQELINQAASLRAQEMANARNAFSAGATDVRSSDVSGQQAMLSQAAQGLAYGNQQLQNQQFNTGLRQQNQEQYNALSNQRDLAGLQYGTQLQLQGNELSNARDLANLQAGINQDQYGQDYRLKNLGLTAGMDQQAVTNTLEQDKIRAGLYGTAASNQVGMTNALTAANAQNDAWLMALTGGAFNAGGAVTAAALK